MWTDMFGVQLKDIKRAKNMMFGFDRNYGWQTVLVGLVIC